MLGIGERNRPVPGTLHAQHPFMAGVARQGSSLLVSCLRDHCAGRRLRAYSMLSRSSILQRAASVLLFSEATVCASSAARGGSQVETQTVQGSPGCTFVAMWEVFRRCTVGVD
ncbi:predicted protein [Plenodomus lingam JN3]|uniref:Predicted protein n=1 Tax=Leptosphaeria maculans (strain JN3 / isolate v23.1.3 / race Av1-4-5-6-7-8) TaxID=985895 RepID=E4ZX75_LEPMJ|nr:predicted protein [Plenodomus lingam JN3]CBX95285.1 predicted protein [Plenodomus lingam JN3]